MLDNSHEIYGKEAEVINKKIKKYQEIQSKIQDIEVTLKPLEKKLKQLKEDIIQSSFSGLNETTIYKWVLQVSKSYESVSLKNIKEDNIDLYKELKDGGYITMSNPSRKITDIEKK